MLYIEEQVPLSIDLVSIDRYTPRALRARLTIRFQAVRSEAFMQPNFLGREHSYILLSHGKFRCLRSVHFSCLARSSPTLPARHFCGRLSKAAILSTHGQDNPAASKGLHIRGRNIRPSYSAHVPRPGSRIRRHGVFGLQVIWEPHYPGEDRSTRLTAIATPMFGWSKDSMTVLWNVEEFIARCWIERQRPDFESTKQCSCHGSIAFAPRRLHCPCSHSIIGGVRPYPKMVLRN